MKRDPYNVLKVPRDASEAEVKQAYRRMALRYHPDTGKKGASAEKFDEITQAYRAIMARLNPKESSSLEGMLDSLLRRGFPFTEASYKGNKKTREGKAKKRKLKRNDYDFEKEEYVANSEKRHKDNQERHARARRTEERRKYDNKRKREKQKERKRSA